MADRAPIVLTPPPMGPDAPQGLIAVHSGCDPVRGWWLRVRWDPITAWHNPALLIHEPDPPGAYEARCTWADHVQCSPPLPDPQFTFWLGRDLPADTICTVMVRGYNCFQW